MSEKTVFVIGAGASKEANLPLGGELKQLIAKRLNLQFNLLGERLEHGDHTIAEALRIHALQRGGRKDINQYLPSAWHIRDALPLAISIDNFIDAHRNNHNIALCGKLGIVRSILDAEKKSILYFDKANATANMNFALISKTWYTSFFQLLTENCNKNELQERMKSITLVVFNYDRCIEHFFYHALQRYYKINEDETANLVKSIDIYHPYGDVGALPWCDSNRAIDFGGDSSSEELLLLATEIRTFTESEESSEKEDIHKKIIEATKLVFLGFAFNKQNMRLITPEHDRKINNAKCYASAYKISKSDQEVIKAQIMDIIGSFARLKLNGYINIVDKKCIDFFAEFWKSLSFPTPIRTST